jgi:DnaJ-class molecular chaperone
VNNSGLNKIKEYLFAKIDHSIPDTHKICPDCEGTRYEDVFTPCETCNREGMVKKTFKELHSLNE